LGIVSHNNYAVLTEHKQENLEVSGFNATGLQGKKKLVKAD
jgi:hypothetical protein